jgi:PhnB protein
MQATNPYLYFDGNCGEAMSFYAKCLGADPPCLTMQEEAANRVLHGEIHAGPLTLMACDVPPGARFTAGNNFSISISCESEEELERLYGQMAEAGEITLALHVAFWGGKLGIVTDRFGVSWMLSYRA